MLIYLMLLDSDRDREEFLRIYDHYRGKFLSIARHYFNDKTQAEDALHDAFVKIANNFKKIMLMPCHEREPYLVTIVMNASRDLLRMEKKYAEWEDHSDVDRGLVPHTAGLEESYRRAVELIYDMPDKYRAILELRLIEGYNNIEAAKRLGVPENTAAQQYNRARKRIAEQLQKEGLGLD